MRSIAIYTLLALFLLGALPGEPGAQQVRPQAGDRIELAQRGGFRAPAFRPAPTYRAPTYSAPRFVRPPAMRAPQALRPPLVRPNVVRLQPPSLRAAPVRLPRIGVPSALRMAGRPAFRLGAVPRQSVVRRGPALQRLGTLARPPGLSRPTPAVRSLGVRTTAAAAARARQAATARPLVVRAARPTGPAYRQLGVRRMAASAANDNRLPPLRLNSGGGGARPPDKPKTHVLAASNRRAVVVTGNTITLMSMQKALRNSQFRPAVDRLLTRAWSKQRPMFVYDPRADRYRSPTTGRFVAFRRVFPPGNGFQSFYKSREPAGSIIVRRGPDGRYFAYPGTSISARGLGMGHANLQDTFYRVKIPFFTMKGPSALVPNLQALGGGTQLFHPISAKTLVKMGVLEPLD